MSFIHKEWSRRYSSPMVCRMVRVKNCLLKRHKEKLSSIYMRVISKGLV